MSRLVIEDNIKETSNSLDELIPEYATNKSSMDKFKKLCDESNKEIKRIMAGISCTQYSVGDWVAKYTIQKRETLNEEKLLNLFQQNEGAIPASIIKVKPYIDMDALEDAIYKEQIPQELLLKMADCKEVKEVETLRITKAKKKEEE